MNEVYIYDILRVPSAKMGGSYKSTLPEELSTFLLNEILNRNQLKGEGEVILANAIGTMGNMARNAVLGSKLPLETSGHTIDSQCGGAYKAIEMATALIGAGMKDWVIAGGMESNSLQPARFYAQNDPRKINDKNVKTANFAPFPSLSLAEAAEKMAVEYSISSEEMLTWTIESHQKTADTFLKGYLSKNVLSFDKRLTKDQMIRPNLSFQKLELLAGKSLINRANTADFHDGAGLVLLGNKGLGIRLSIKPLAIIKAINFTGIHPDLSPQGIIYATKKLNHTYPIRGIDLFEICESYAVKPLAFAKEFGIESKKMNVLGGNLAMGHPFAASGVINVLNLLLALQLNKKKVGLVTAGIAGGLGVSMLIENLK